MSLGWGTDTATPTTLSNGTRCQGHAKNVRSTQLIEILSVHGRYDNHASDALFCGGGVVHGETGK